MKVGQLRRLPGLAFGVLLLLIVSAPVAFADNQPYLKTYGADVMAGGWFNNQSQNCDVSSGSDYQDGAYNSSADPNNGGILTYSRQASGAPNGGASSQYGAFALGPIDGDGGIKGFYSAGALVGSAPAKAVNYLSFANTSPATPWGGLFEGSSRQLNDCIYNYYQSMPASPTPLASPISSATTSGNYSASPASGTAYNLTSGAVTIAANSAATPPTRITVYVNGNVYIHDNITYQSGDADHVPKFMLVVKGSIYIDPSVTRLDGFYVAQPSTDTAAAVNSDTGIIWTCFPDPSVTPKIDFTWPATNCPKPLVVNGSLVAKQLNFLRMNGDINSSSPVEDSSYQTTLSKCSTAPFIGCNVGEIINYTPQMVMGGGFFTGVSGSSSTPLPLDSIVSLPPAF